MGEDKKLAIVFSKSQCSSYPKAHYTYKDRFGKPLKMSIVRLPSKLYRPSGLDFGVFDGVNRNEVLAYINVPGDMIKKDKNNENRRFFYLERDEYNIQFITGNGNGHKIEPFRVTAKELEDIFNWHRRKENREELQDRLAAVEAIKEQNEMKVEMKKEDVIKMKEDVKKQIIKVYVESGVVKMPEEKIAIKVENKLAENELDGIRNDMKKIEKHTGVDNSNVIKQLDNYGRNYMAFEELNERFGKMAFSKPMGRGR